MASFSTEVRNELARLNEESTCCQRAELAALLRMGGAMVLGGGGVGMNFTSENAAVARKVLSLIKRGVSLRTEVVVSRARRLKKNNSYLVKVTPSPHVKEVLLSLGILGGEGLNIGQDSPLLRKQCCRRAYLRGAFLGGGSVNRPEGDYHLELVSANPDFARTLAKVMKGFSLPVGLTERKQDYVVYLKGGDAITEFLQIIGAHNALLDFENVRVVKGMRNQVNRLVNCETANLQKTVNAAVRQAAGIQRLASRGELEKLPKTLQETAHLRITHPEASLQELVDLLDGKVSRSGLNHRLRKLEELALKL
ncbi:DNA-binding protein WhiA [Azotosporobacter soli]|uniref:DNA-binding protein WhiA n=1 Tax=Azotosporobacter soli TaxID=3055040 RepID=UPI0031FF079C